MGKASRTITHTHKQYFSENIFQLYDDFQDILPCGICEKCRKSISNSEPSFKPINYAKVSKDLRSIHNSNTDCNCDLICKVSKWNLMNTKKVNTNVDLSHVPLLGGASSWHIHPEPSHTSVGQTEPPLEPTTSVAAASALCAGGMVQKQQTPATVQTGARAAPLQLPGGQLQPTAGSPGQIPGPSAVPPQRHEPSAGQAVVPPVPTEPGAYSPVRDDSNTPMCTPPASPMGIQ